MLKNYIFFLLLLSAFMSQFVSAQEGVRDSSISASIMAIQYTYNIPHADLEDRFGPISALGLSYTYKHYSNFFFSAEYNFLFNGKVNENPVSNIVAPSTGLLIDGDGFFEIMELQMRGMLIQTKAGKVFAVIGPNQNSGIALSLGTGFLQHQIHYNTRSAKLPQLDGEYEKGYDRLTNGWLLSQSLGYFNLSNNGFVNFQASLEVTEGFTRNRRDWDNELMRKLDEPRMDVMVGLRLAWYIPLYRRTGSYEYY